MTFKTDSLTLRRSNGDIVVAELLRAGCIFDQHLVEFLVEHRFLVGETLRGRVGTAHGFFAEGLKALFVGGPGFGQFAVDGCAEVAYGRGELFAILPRRRTGFVAVAPEFFAQDTFEAFAVYALEHFEFRISIEPRAGSRETLLTRDQVEDEK